MPHFTFNGRNSADIEGLIINKTRRPILPSTQDVYLEIPQRDGSYLFKGAENDRFIELEITIIGNIAQRQQKARELAAFLRTEKQEKLLFADEPDKYYLGKVSSQVDFETIANIGEGLIIFRCQPFAFSELNTSETTVTDDTPIFIFNNGNTSAPQEITITNLGLNTLNGFKIKVIKSQ